jgi:hypothetical protein
MAIGPEKYLTSNKDRLVKAEAKIDKILSETTSRYGKVVTVTTKGLGITPSEFETFLKAKYITAGWAGVVWKNDPRDEDWIEFTLPLEKT